jgi:hypothetical protein
MREVRIGDVKGGANEYEIEMIRRRVFISQPVTLFVPHE